MERRLPWDLSCRADHRHRPHRRRVQPHLEDLREADSRLPPEQRRHRVLERADFDRMCREAGGVGPPEYLLRYLDANDFVFHHLGLFHDRVVLDQAWALDAICAVFDRSGALRDIRRDGGRFRQEIPAMKEWYVSYAWGDARRYRAAARFRGADAIRV
jgi:internalin A